MAKRKYRVVIAPEARDDLRQELNYLRRNRSTQTARYVRDGIQDEISKLDHLPKRHPKLHRISDENRTYRFAPKLAYLIIFRIEEAIKQVRVVSIFNGRQSRDKVDDIKGQ
jgi:plasmid stabilization system protein ParE